MVQIDDLDRPNHRRALELLGQKRELLVLNRRDFLAVASAAAGAAVIEKSASAGILGARSQDAASPSFDPVRHVNVFLGTGGHGHCFPGATVPFGAVQLSPDTGMMGWDWCSGYHHDDTTLMGFSHTHLSGTGASDMLDLLLVPRTGEVILNPGTDEQARKDPAGTYRSRF